MELYIKIIILLIIVFIVGTIGYFVYDYIVNKNIEEEELDEEDEESEYKLFCKNYCGKNRRGIYRPCTPSCELANCDNCN